MIVTPLYPEAQERGVLVNFTEKGEGKSYVTQRRDVGRFGRIFARAPGRQVSKQQAS